MKLYKLCIIIIIAISLFSGCLGNSDNDNTENNNTNEEPNYFNLDVRINTLGNYSILFPVLLDSNGNCINVVYNNLTIKEGNLKYVIQNNSYGLGLNVTGENNIKLNSHLENYEFLYYPFSMQKSDNGILKKKGNIEYWVYVYSINRINLSIDIYFTSTHDYGGYINNISGNVTNGWNIINGHASAGGS